LHSPKSSFFSKKKNQTCIIYTIYVSTRFSNIHNQVFTELVVNIKNVVDTGQVTSESNVYSFGVVLLEMLTGRRALDQTLPREEQNLVEWLRHRLKNKANFHYLMDPRLEGQYPTKCAHKTMRIATHCLRLDPKARPLMSEVVHKLKRLHDEMVRGLGPSASFGSVDKGPSNHGRAKNYRLGKVSSPNVLSCFQASPQREYYPLPLPPPSPNPWVGSSSNS